MQPSRIPIILCLTVLEAANLAGAARAAEAPASVAVFDFEFVNTSLQPTTQAETARLQRLDAALRQALDQSGRYHVIAAGSVPDSPSPQTPPRPAVSPRNCNGCELALARAAGARLAAYGWMQKVSNLILNINLVIEDAATGRHLAVGSVDIRGNTDQSWAHGLRFLLHERIFAE